MAMEFLREVWNDHRSKVLGATLGIVVGIVILVFGFFKALFIALCAFVGWHIGNAIDRNESIKDILGKILPPGNR